MKELGDILAEFARRPNESFALATLVRARGSSYRRPGARMLIAPDGTYVGALSGGCLEDEIALRGREVIVSGQPVLLSFDTRLRYGCNGAIDILVEKVRPGFFLEIAQRLQARRECIAATIFEKSNSLGSVVLDHEKNPAGAFCQTLRPPLQLVIVGDGPGSDALRVLASSLGWIVFEAEQAAALPDEFDAWTAAIVKTHNYGRDFSALAKLLPLDLRYVGLLGSRSRRDQLLHALAENGVPIRAEFFAPVGLDLGADSPEEIALAIVAEIQAVFAGARVASLRERRTPIHIAGDLAVA